MKTVAFVMALLACAVQAACSDDSSQTPPADADVDAQDTGSDDAAPACPAGQVLCGYECFDPQTDRTHCGRCWNVCGELSTCVDGQCRCLDAYDLCGDECVDVMIDSDHCGACDAPCETMAYCLEGVCVCGEGLTDCDGECVDTNIDSDHCGWCDHACTGGEFCNGSGVCDFQCTAPYSLCSPGDDPYCADLQTDPMNCSACGHDCPVRDHAAATCTDGTCTMVCDSGYGDANGDESDGCECTITGASEECDGIDNDCSGETDEGFDCVLGSTEACTLTASCAGFHQCVLPSCTWDECVNMEWACLQPGTDTESQDCGGGSCGTQTRVCSDTCSWGDWGTCVLKSSSVCFDGATQSCTTGCDTTGTETCTGACQWGSCAPPSETCNGLDDDCDGDADEDFECPAGQSRCCSGGVQQCSSGCAWESCTPCGSGTTCCDIGDMDRCCESCSPPTGCV